MKKTFITTMILAMFLFSVVMMLPGCSIYDTPPDVVSVQQQYLKNRDNLNLLVDFMIDSGFEDIYITDTSGTMLADLAKIPIDSDEISTVLNDILGSSAYLHISKNGNTISLLQWKGIRDIGCGIACVIDGADMPEIQYVTELQPISDDGWFYYISDYNDWRYGKRPQENRTVFTCSTMSSFLATAYQCTHIV